MDDNINVVRPTETAVRVACDLRDAGVDPETPAAAFLAELPRALRKAVINEANGEAWETVELRRHDDKCLCDDCDTTTSDTAEA